MANITKQDLINEISKDTGLTQADTKVAVEEFLSVVSQMLISGKHIEIRGFGTFLTKLRKPRPARNPKTGEIVPLQERIVPLFKFSSDLKRRIDQGKIQQKNDQNIPSDQNNTGEDQILY